MSVGVKSPPLTVRKATAFMSKQRKRIANVRFTNLQNDDKIAISLQRYSYLRVKAVYNN